MTRHVGGPASDLISITDPEHLVVCVYQAYRQAAGGCLPRRPANVKT